MARPQIIKTRAANIRKQITGKKADAFLVTKVANVTYLTGFLGDDSWALVTNKAVYLITDNRYTEQAQAQCPCCRIVERKDSMAKAIGKLLKRYKSIKNLAVESSISAGGLKTLRKELKVRIELVTGITETVRRKKDESEISVIKKAASIALKALKVTRKKIKPGITENQLTGLLELEIRKLGGKCGFETIIAFGANASRPHHQPTDKKLKKNDSVLIDFGAKVDGYTCDITRTFPVGKPSKLFKKVYKAVEDSQKTAIRKIKTGVKLKDVDEAARETIRQHGFTPYGHGTGHGLGLEVHESPRVSDKVKGKLQTGDVITIEPGIYIPGKLGVRIEDDILVTENGYTILSKS